MQSVSQPTLAACSSVACCWPLAAGHRLLVAVVASIALSDAAAFGTGVAAAFAIALLLSVMVLVLLLLLSSPL